jgi:hypothetical protein
VAGWRRLLESLGEFQRSEVDQGATVLSFGSGLLVVGVRTDFRRNAIEDVLRDVDFTLFFEGFRRLEIRVTDEGQTGRERRDEATQRAQATAVEQVDASPAVSRLKKRFDAVVAEVVATPPPARDTWAPSEEESDERPL